MNLILHSNIFLLLILSCKTKPPFASHEVTTSLIYIGDELQKKVLKAILQLNEWRDNVFRHNPQADSLGIIVESSSKIDDLQEFMNQNLSDNQTDLFPAEKMVHYKNTVQIARDFISQFQDNIQNQRRLLALGGRMQK
jgi:hypothetical protein